MNLNKSILKKEKQVTHCLHIENSGLGNNHRPVTCVSLQLCFRPLERRSSCRVHQHMWKCSEAILPHKLAKILQNQSMRLKPVQHCTTEEEEKCRIGEVKTAGLR